MRSQNWLLLSFCLFAWATAPAALGQDASASPDPSATSGNGTPASEPVRSGISEWALAGVVWSDASLTRKLATDALGQAQSEGASSPAQESLQQLAQQSQQIIESLEQFGWSQKQANTGNTAPAQNPSTAGTADVDAGIDTAAPERADVAPSTRDVVAEKMDAAEALGEAEAAVANPLTPVPRPSTRMSQRDGQTLSDTLPYSAGSIYDRGDYRPGDDYTNRAPMSVGATHVYSGEIDEIEREVQSDARRANDQSARQGEPKVDPRVTAGLLRRIEMDDYTTAPQSDADELTGHADARWVQFRLDANQWTYSHVQPNERIPAARAALRQLQATAMTAGRSTQDAKLKQILAPILKLSL